MPREISEHQDAAVLVAPREERPGQRTKNTSPDLPMQVLQHSPTGITGFLQLGFGQSRLMFRHLTRPMTRRLR